MTLFKQFLFVSLLFVTVILGMVWLNNYHKTTDFIKAQLGANAKHTALSLGLVISSEANKALAKANGISAENVEKSADLDYSQVLTSSFAKSLIEPIFKSGHYLRISLKDAKGKMVYEAINEPKYIGLANWFVKSINLPTPLISQEVYGIGKIGTLRVQISPEFAYAQMYSLFSDLLAGLLIIFLCAFLFLYFAIKTILAPLACVRRQAEAILNKEFIIQKRLPFTQEVRKVVEAMNVLVDRVKNIFEKEAQILDSYNELLYTDEVSGLKNRRYFVNKYKEYLSSEEYSGGYFLLLSIKETYDLKKLLGFEKSVEFLKELAKYLRSCMLTKHENIFRLNANDFALIIFDKYELINEINKTLDKIKSLFEHYLLDDSAFEVRAALVYFDKTPLNELLSKADILLIQSKVNFALNGSMQTDDELALSRQEYKELISSAIQDDKFQFASQDVLENGAIYQEELYLRLKTNSGKLKSAAYFMPIVNELHLSEKIDFYVLEKALKYAQNLNHFVAINLSASFIKSKNYERIAGLLNANNCSNICFELAMSKSLKINELIAFAKFIRRWDISLGLDHFSLSKENLMILNELHVSYVKIPIGLLLDLLEDSSASGAVNSLDIILNTKNVKIIAIGIENELSQNTIKRLNLSALQGRHIAPIKEI